MVTYGLAHRMKYARLIQRAASSARAEGSDRESQRYFVQVALEGVPYHKPKHVVGHDRVGLDLGPSTIALVPREGTPRLEVLCAELAPDTRAIRRLQRQMDRQQRANNPEHYDAQGRIKKGGKQRLHWKHSKRYLATRRRKATVGSQRGVGAMIRVSERVCLKVQAEPHKSPPALTSDGKRGSKARNLQGFSPERSQFMPAVPALGL